MSLLERLRVLADDPLNERAGELADALLTAAGEIERLRRLLDEAITALDDVTRVPGGPGRPGLPGARAVAARALRRIRDADELGEPATLGDRLPVDG